VEHRGLTTIVCSSRTARLCCWYGWSSRHSSESTATRLLAQPAHHRVLRGDSVVVSEVRSCVRSSIAA